MPELPDVETLKRYVDATSLHRRVQHLHVFDTSLLEDVSRQKLVAALVGAPFDRTTRHGKYLGVHSSGGSWLLLHFGMTGDLSAQNRDRELPEFTALEIDFADGLRLAYTNARRLGTIAVAADFDAFVADRKLGPDALGIGLAAFRDVLAGHHGALKPLLMNQQVIAGLGNEYVDETLYQAGLRPDRPVDELSDSEVKRLHRTLARILKTAIDRHADPESFPSGWLQRRRSAGRSCPRCAGEIVKSRVGGRATYWCPACQS